MKEEEEIQECPDLKKWSKNALLLKDTLILLTKIFEIGEVEFQDDDGKFDQVEEIRKSMITSEL